jgi:phosphopantothenate synthetase
MMTDHADQTGAEQRPALFSAQWPWPEVAPAGLAELYRAAAIMITVRRYSAYDEREYAGERGISIGHALEMAATAYVTATADLPPVSLEGGDRLRAAIKRDAAALAEELSTRLAAVLYVLGQQHLRTGVSDLSDVVAGWELGHDDIKRRVDEPMALALLESAAGIYDMIAATDGADPVTIAPPIGGQA